MRLKDMKRGDSATVVGIGGRDMVKKRILDLGITKGCKIKMVRIAPLGDPVELELRGYRLTIRMSDAEFVEIDDITPESPGDDSR